MDIQSLDRTKSNRKCSTRVIKSLKLGISIFVLCVFIDCALLAYAQNIHDFLGPAVGVEYIYEATDGGNVKLKGIKKENKNSILVHETKFFLLTNLPEGFPTSTTIRYKLVVIDNQIIKSYNNITEIVLSKDETWEIVGKTGKPLKNSKDYEWFKIKSFCRRISSDKELLFGENRTILTTKCITEYDSNVTVKIEKYASGIGLIERTIKAGSKGKDSRIVNKITLIDIKNNN